MHTYRIINEYTIVLCRPIGLIIDLFTCLFELKIDIND